VNVKRFIIKRLRVFQRQRSALVAEIQKLSDNMHMSKIAGFFEAISVSPLGQ